MAETKVSIKIKGSPNKVAKALDKFSGKTLREADYRTLAAKDKSNG